MYNRRQVIIGAILLVVTTFVLTSGGLLYMLHVRASDITSTLRVFRVLELVKARYVEDVPVETMVNGAIKGMVNALGDPHSIYMDAKMFKEFMIETEGAFGGVGIVIGIKDKALTVISPIEGTPGEKAGIKAGDRIIKINGQDTKDMLLDEAVSKIRGPEGTQVTLAIRRAGAESQDYIVTRSNIQIKTVSGKMLSGNIGYIRISMFNETTGSNFERQYSELEKAGMKALILDLRDNPGGLLDASVKVAGKLVPKGPIVSVAARDGHKETQYSSLEQVKYPLLVLVNGGSASASEIVAGAVQDTGAGTLLGSKTFGKGSVQTILRLDGGTGIKLTIAKYYTPNSRSIDGIGIEPDIKLEMPETKEQGQDLQLEKGIEILKSKI